MFWGAIVTVTIVGAIWSWPIDRVAHIERTFVGALGGATLAAILIKTRPLNPAVGESEESSERPERGQFMRHLIR